MAVYLMKSYPVSTTRACKVIDLPKSMFYYQFSKDDQPVIYKLNELDSMRVNHKAGQDKLYDRIRSEGIPWNYKRVRRVYLAMGLKHRQRTKRRLPKREKQPLTVPIGRNMSWSMDFSFPSHGVVRMLERAIREYGIPMKIRVDNGPEFTCSVVRSTKHSDSVYSTWTPHAKCLYRAIQSHFPSGCTGRLHL